MLQLTETVTSSSLPAAETFAVGSALTSEPWQEGLFDWDSFAQLGPDIVTHCPIDAGWAGRCHSFGARCFPYVQFLAGSPEVQFGKGPTTFDHYQGIHWALHTDWYRRDPSGNTTIWQFGAPHADGVGIVLTDPLVVCPNVADYQDAMVARVDYIMEQGADGVYVDVVEGRDPCYGEQLVIHNHVVPDEKGVNFPKASADATANQNLAFGLLLKRVRQTVQARRPDGLVSVTPATRST